MWGNMRLLGTLLGEFEQGVAGGSCIVVVCDVKKKMKPPSWFIKIPEVILDLSL